MAARKTKTKLPIHLTNLGSTTASVFDFTDADLYGRMRPEVWQLAKDTPVYLVAPNQMDAIAPPRKALGNLECLRKAIRRWEETLQERKPDPERQEDWERERKRRWDTLSECYTTYHTVALYVPTYRQVSASFLHKPITGRAIFICPERLKDWADDQNVPYPIALAEVYYERLAHAELDTGAPPPVKAPWVQVIENSLGCMLALTQFPNIREAHLARRFMESSPLEDRGYRYLWQPFYSARWHRLYYPFRWYYGFRYAGHIGHLLHMVDPRVLERATHLITDMQSKGIPIPEIIERVGRFIYHESPLGDSESHRVTEYLMESGGIFYLSDIEPPIPFRYLSPRRQWLAYKRGLPNSIPAAYWEELAWAIIKRLAGL